jgi:transposase
MAKYRIKLTKDEVGELTSIKNKGSHTTQAYRAALVLLNCDEGEFSSGKNTHQQISDVLKIGMRTIDRIKQRFVEGGFERALERAESSRIYDKKIDGDLEAKMVQLCCSEPPAGYAKWTLRLLAEKIVELEYIDYISHVSVYNTLKNNELRPWKVKNWVIPPEQNAEFVANMEQVLDVYKRSYDENNPVVCMDESPKQMVETIREEKIEPGKDKRVDYEYVRHGVANVFMANEPLSGKRTVEITETKKKRIGRNLSKK